MSKNIIMGGKATILTMWIFRSKHKGTHHRSAKTDSKLILVDSSEDRRILHDNSEEQSMTGHPSVDAK